MHAEVGGEGVLDPDLLKRCGGMDAGPMKMPRLLYLADVDLQAGGVPAIQVMNTCAGFASLGWNVTLVVFRYVGGEAELIQGDLWSFFGLSPTFRVQWLRMPLWRRVGSSTVVSRILKSLPVLAYASGAILRMKSGDVCYGRSPGFLRLFTLLRFLAPRKRRPRVVYEAHEPLAGRGYRRLLEDVDGVVSLTHRLADHLTERYGLAQTKVFVEPDAADYSRFQNDASEESLRNLRALWVLPSDVRICCWAGQLLVDEMQLIIEAGRLIPPPWFFVCVGGPAARAEELDATAKAIGARVRFVGPVAHAEIPRVLRAADILIAPYTTSLRYAPFFSPMKIFEYMAAGKPIVCSNLPAILEILQHGKNAYLVQADDPRALAEGIRALDAEPNMATRIANEARVTAQNHTWIARCRRITEFLRLTSDGATEIVPFDNQLARNKN